MKPVIRNDRTYGRNAVAHVAVLPFTWNKIHTCSSRVNFEASSFALSSGFSSEYSFLPAMVSHFDDEVGVSDGVTVSIGVTWKVACFKSISLLSSSVGLRVPRCMVVMANQPKLLVGDSQRIQKSRVTVGRCELETLKLSRPGEVARKRTT